MPSPHATLTAAILSGMLASTALGQLPTYSFTTIAIPGANTVTVTGINAAGTIVGYYRDAAAHYHGFIQSNGVLSPVDHPGSTSTFLQGINDAGVVTGSYASGYQTPFTWQNGVFTPFSLPPNSGSTAAIDDTGTVVGSYGDTQAQNHGFRFDGNGVATIDYPGVQHTNLNGRNNLGVEVGNYWDGTAWRGFVLQGGTFTPLDMPGASWTVLENIDDAGWITGQQVDQSGVHRTAIVYDGTQFWPLAVPGATGWSEANARNAAGVVVGYFQGTENGVYGQYGFVAEPFACQPDLGFGTPGGAELAVCGEPLGSGGTATAQLTNAPANTPAWVALGLSSNPTPLFGGTLVVNPPELIVGVVTDGFGEWTLTNIQGGGGPTSLFLQVAYLDLALPQAIGLSNAVRVDYLP